MRIANSRLRSNRNEPMDYDEALAKLGTLADDRTEKWEMVLLLGNPGTIATARTWHRRVWEIEFFARVERTDADQYDALQEQVDALQEQVDADRTRFYEAARHDLGISSGEVPRGGRWDAPPQTSSSDESSQAATEVQ